MLDASLIIVVPSQSFPPEVLNRVPIATHFEQRLLFLLAHLRRMDNRVVYVTSTAIDPETVDYSLSLTSALDPRDRLRLLHCADPSPRPLTAKLLADPDLIGTLRGCVTDPGDTLLVTYNTTPLEAELARTLGVPLYSCDPALTHLGTKSGGRRLLREAGVPIPDGFENVHTTEEVADALAALRTTHPDRNTAMVKLDDGFAGMGNARFDFTGAPGHGLRQWITRHLPRRMSPHGLAGSWHEFSRTLASQGGVVESYLDPELSPSVQLEISVTGTVRVISTHDQILAGPLGQSFTGAAFPAAPEHRTTITRHAERVGQLLASHGVTGHLSIDFVIASGIPHGIEINLRMGGTTAPFFLADTLLRGAIDPSGTYRLPDGSPRHYLTSDRIHRCGLQNTSPRDLLDLAQHSGLAFNFSSGTGCAFYSLGPVPERGQFGLLAIDHTREAAQALYEKFLSTLDTHLPNTPCLHCSDSSSGRRSAGT